jgi:glycosyltransferase involved in cell wall biosynthesis
MSEIRKKGLDVELLQKDYLARYRVVVFSKTYDTSSLAIAKAVHAHGGRVIFDLCDNHFYNPFDLPAYTRAKFDIGEMVKIADHVVCSSQYLADVVQAQTGAIPSVIGDPIEDLPYSMNDESAPQQGHLLWFGNHGSPNAPGGMEDLLRIKEALIAARATHPFELVVASNSLEKYQNVIAPALPGTTYVKWQLGTFARLLQSAVGVVIPITRNPFTLAKTNNRLAMALAAGIPVVADSIPSYEELGNYCYLDNWGHGLTNVLSCSDDARRRTLDGRSYVNERYHASNIGTQWFNLISGCLSEQKGGIKWRQP